MSAVPSELFDDNAADVPLPVARQRTAEVLARLAGFLEVFRCGLNYQAAQPEFRNDDEALSPFHSRGYLQGALQPAQQLPPEMVEAWVRDPDHGLLHGLSVAFFALLVRRGSDLRYFAEDEVLFASCLLHDFLRSNGCHEDHDRLLKSWFPRLDQVTYSHSRPDERDNFHPLVVGDRLELMRYADYRDWVRPEILSLYLRNRHLRELANVYFHRVRPALERLFANWGGVWLRHGVENDHVLRTAGQQGDEWLGRIERAAPGFFPQRYWAPRPGEWGVEIGMAPFGLNITRAMSEYGPLPILSLDRYHELGGAPLVPFRDHLCARATVPLGEWVLLLYDNDLARPECADLLSGCRGFVDLRLANRVLEIGRYLSALLTAMGAGVMVA